MDKYFKVQISYPNGQVEEIEEVFLTLNAAKAYGNNLLIQVVPNENYHETLLDEFEEVQRQDAYYFVIEVEEDKKELVYDSRKGK